MSAESEFIATLQHRLAITRRSLGDAQEMIDSLAERLSSGSICEFAASNPSVAEYCRHWESRAEAAEARLRELASAEPVAWQSSAHPELIARYSACALPSWHPLIRRPSMEKES